MKKIISILLSILMLTASVFCFSGCGERAIIDLSDGPLYTLEKVFNAQKLTREDIKHISYFKYGKVIEGTIENEQNWEEIDFTPSKELGSLDETIEKEIKQTYYEKNLTLFNDKNGEKIGDVENIKVKFYGEYNGYYAIEIDVDFIDIATVEEPYAVDNVIFMNSETNILVYTKYNLMEIGGYKINEKWQKENRTYGAYYFTDDDVVEDKTSPRTRTFLIKNKKSLLGIFSEGKEIDFKQKMVIVHAYTDIYGRARIIESVKIDNDNVLQIDFKVAEGLPGYGDASMPQQRFLVLLIDKADVKGIVVTKL